MTVLRLSVMCRMSDLAVTFPTLERAEGLYPFDPEVFNDWACARCYAHGAVYAARFILAVWSGRMGRVSDKPRKAPKFEEVGDYRWNIDSCWRLGPFDVVDALGTWDAQHRSAFVAWARSPWWP